jgi:hypothetical protein
VLLLEPGGTHEFDAVSADGSVVAGIKSNSGLTSGGNHPTGKVATCLNKVYYLALVSAPTRLLVLTNPRFHAIFTKATSGAIAPGVEVVLVALPAEMQHEVDQVTKQASGEMAPDASLAAAAALAEEAGEQGAQS